MSNPTRRFEKPSYLEPLHPRHSNTSGRGVRGGRHAASQQASGWPGMPSIDLLGEHRRPTYSGTNVSSLPSLSIRVSRLPARTIFWV